MSITGKPFRKRTDWEMGYRWWDSKPSIAASRAIGLAGKCFSFAAKCTYGLAAWLVEGVIRRGVNRRNRYFRSAQ